MSTEAAQDPNNVKVVTADDGRALYFSRAPIPYDRDGTHSVVYYKHIGLYAYTRAALSLFHRLPQSALEQAERLEQLRFFAEQCAFVLCLKLRLIRLAWTQEADLERVIALFGAGS